MVSARRFQADELLYHQWGEGDEPVTTVSVAV
jgi:hypothetical protein